MFEISKEQLESLGAVITVNEIRQQPDLWEDALKIYQDNKEKITSFMDMLHAKHEWVRVIFAGAGTSAYAGDSITPYLKRKVDESFWDLMSVPTTDLVSNPYDFLESGIPTVLVSFSRSGNSPESVASVNLGKQVVKDFYQITITCAPDGELANQAHNDEKNLLLVIPGANDKGFAMTGSFTCMSLMALLIFDTLEDTKKAALVPRISAMGREVIQREPEIQGLVDLDCKRIIFLGSGGFVGIAREAGLKLLELTAGKIATMFDSSMGFRHGPKSFVDEDSQVFVFTSSEPYTRKYDLDILNEIHGDKIAKNTCSISFDCKENFDGPSFLLTDDAEAPADAYMALPFIMVAQTFATMAALKIGNKPDTPSPTGTVNRVVKGVILHDYEN